MHAACLVNILREVMPIKMLSKMQDNSSSQYIEHSTSQIVPELSSFLDTIEMWDGAQEFNYNRTENNEIQAVYITTNKKGKA